MIRIIIYLRYLTIGILFNLLSTYAFANSDNVTVIYTDKYDNTVSVSEKKDNIHNGFYNLRVYLKNNKRDIHDTNTSEEKIIEIEKDYYIKNNFIINNKVLEMINNYDALSINYISKNSILKNHYIVDLRCNNSVSISDGSNVLKKTIFFDNESVQKGFKYYLKRFTNELDSSVNYYGFHDNETMVHHHIFEAGIEPIVAIRLYFSKNHTNIKNVNLRVYSGIFSPAKVYPLDLSTAYYGQGDKGKYIEYFLDKSIINYIDSNEVTQFETIVFTDNDKSIKSIEIESGKLPVKSVNYGAGSESGSEGLDIVVGRNYKRLLIDSSEINRHKYVCGNIDSINIIERSDIEEPNDIEIQNFSLVNYSTLNTDLFNQQSRTKQYNMDLYYLDQPINIAYDINELNSLSQAALNNEKFVLHFEFVDDNKIIGVLSYLIFGVENYSIPISKISNNIYWHVETPDEQYKPIKIENLLGFFNKGLDKNTNLPLLTKKQIDEVRITSELWSKNNIMPPSLSLRVSEKYLTPVQSDENILDENILLVGDKKVLLDIDSLDKDVNYIDLGRIEVIDNSIRVEIPNKNSPISIADLLLTKLEPINQNELIDYFSEPSLLGGSSIGYWLKILLLTISLGINMVYVIFSKSRNNYTIFISITILIGYLTYNNIKIEYVEKVLSMILLYIWLVSVYYIYKLRIDYTINKRDETLQNNLIYKINSAYLLSLLVFVVFIMSNLLSVPFLANFKANILILLIVYIMVLNIINSDYKKIL